MKSNGCKSRPVKASEQVSSESCHSPGDWWVRSVDSKEAGREDSAPSRSGKLGRGGTNDELVKPLIVIQRVQIPPDQSRADKSEASLAIHRATGGCEA